VNRSSSSRVTLRDRMQRAALDARRGQRGVEALGTGALALHRAGRESLSRLRERERDRALERVRALARERTLGAGERGIAASSAATTSRPCRASRARSGATPLRRSPPTPRRRCALGSVRTGTPASRSSCVPGGSRDASGFECGSEATNGPEARAVIERNLQLPRYGACPSHGARGLRFFDELVEGRGVVDRDLGELLAVQLMPALWRPSMNCEYVMPRIWQAAPMRTIHIARKSRFLRRRWGGERPRAQQGFRDGAPQAVNDRPSSPWLA
jgi:hypothetical protein